jgi:hypothetical protein
MVKVICLNKDKAMAGAEKTDLTFISFLFTNEQTADECRITNILKSQESRMWEAKKIHIHPK